MRAKDAIQDMRKGGFFSSVANEKAREWAAVFEVELDHKEQALDRLRIAYAELEKEKDAEIERLTEDNARLRRMGDRLSLLVGQLEDRNAEIERLQRKLMIVWNFPSHPGGHPADQSADAMVEEDWRHGWICAVEAIQEAITDGT